MSRRKSASSLRSTLCLLLISAFAVSQSALADEQHLQQSPIEILSQAGPVLPPAPMPGVQNLPLHPALPVPVIPGQVSETVTAPATAPAEAGVPLSGSAADTSALAAQVSENGIIVIDNDDEYAKEEVVETYKWAEVPDAVGQSKLSAGIQFPIIVVSELNSKTAKVGDPVEAKTRVDLKIGGKMIAPKGTRVVGHVSMCSPARRILHAEISGKRWFRAQGAIGLTFDEIITASGEHLPLIAKPARMSRIVENKNEGRVMGVNTKGEVTSPLSVQLKHQALHLAIRAAASAGGVFSMGAVPVAYGVIGAINPSFAYLQPVGRNVPHRRIKGFGMGVLSGLPGGFLVVDTIIRGPEARIKPGDQFLVEFKQDFTGEAATEAQLLQNAKTKVHGEVINQDKKKKK